VGSGGARPNSGRIRHPITKLADRLISAFPLGYQIAGEKKGLTGEDVQLQVVANILADEILAGRGINVVRLEADLLGKVTGKGEGNGEKSALLDALSKCPGLLPDTQTALNGEVVEKSVTQTMTYTQRTTHSKCEGRENEPLEGFFNPQLALPLDAMDEG